MVFAPMPFFSAKLSGDPAKAISVLDIDARAEAGVAVGGPAAAYALVWEFGNLRQHKKGPKTVMGVNLQSGASVWLSSQAPRGYVRSNEHAMWRIIANNLKLLNFDSREKLIGSLKLVVEMSAVAIKDLIADAAPIDSGQLRGSIYVVSGSDVETFAQSTATLNL